MPGENTALMDGPSGNEEIMDIRELRKDETELLYDCIVELSEYHNEVSANFKGIYPTHRYEDTLANFKAQVACGNSRIAVIGDSGIDGFCKVDINGAKGKLDYLMVTKAQRGKGYGRALMDWAMKTFADNGVSAIEVKVVYGNPALHLYEKYGFCKEAYILRRDAASASTVNAGENDRRGEEEKNSAEILTRFFRDCGFSLLALVTSIYYLAKRSTGSLLSSVDIIVCGAVILFCFGNIAYYIYKMYIEK